MFWIIKPSNSYFLGINALAAPKEKRVGRGTILHDFVIKSGTFLTFYD
jgi:hypothetical protein